MNMFTQSATTGSGFSGSLKTRWLAISLLLLTACLGLWKLAESALSAPVKLPMLVVLPAGLAVYTVLVLRRPAVDERADRQKATDYLRAVAVVAAAVWIVLCFVHA
jgi:hypothetical protein